MDLDPGSGLRPDQDREPSGRAGISGFTTPQGPGAKTVDGAEGQEELTVTDLLYIGIMAGAFLACAVFIPLLKRK
jgi:hypothetical protein